MTKAPRSCCGLAMTRPSRLQLSAQSDPGKGIFWGGPKLKKSGRDGSAFNGQRNTPPTLEVSKSPLFGSKRGIIKDGVLTNASSWPLAGFQNSKPLVVPV